MTDRPNKTHTKRGRTRRRLLTASAGVVAFTAFEGLACGNPVAPAYEKTATSQPSIAPTAPPPSSATTPPATSASTAPGAVSSSTPTVTSRLER